MTPVTDARFDACLPLILREEGGDDDDPRDHGGRTAHGITQGEYDKWRPKWGLPLRDVWQASDEEVRAIYYAGYWLPICPHLPPGVDLCFFNAAVNAGPRRAVVILQVILAIAQDSDEFKAEHEYVGPVTLAALAKVPPAEVVQKFQDRLQAFYQGLAQFPTFGKGWTRRTARIRAAAASMAIAAPKPTTPTKEPPMTTPTAAADPIPEIIAFLEIARKYLPVVAGFLPPPLGTIATAGIPIIEELLQLVEDAKSKSGVDLLQVIGQHLQTIGGHVQTAATQAAQPVPAPATPNV